MFYADNFLGIVTIITQYCVTARGGVRWNFCVQGVSGLSEQPIDWMYTYTSS